MTTGNITERRSKISSFWLTLAVLGGIAGLVQDLLIPLAPVGVWFGYAFIIAGAVLVVVKEHGKLGQFIQSLTEHWKWPVVASSFALGALLIVASYFSQSVAGERGYLAEHMAIAESIQKALLPAEEALQDAVIATEEARDEAEVIEQKSAVVEEMSRATIVDELNRLGIDVSSPKALWNVMENYSGEELERILTMMKDANYNLTQRVNTWPDLAGVLGQSDVNVTLMLPQFTNAVNALMMIPFDPNNLPVFLRVFPEALTIRTPTSTKIAETSIRGDIGCSDPMILDHHPVHPLGECADGVGLVGVYGTSLVSYFEAEAGKPLSKIRGEYTLLHSAAAMNRADFIPILAEFGADLNAESAAGYTALELAAERAQVDAAKALVEAGADVTHNNYRAASYAFMRSRAGTLGMRLAFTQPPQDFAEALGEPAQNRTFMLGKQLLKGTKLTGENRTVVINAIEQVTKTIDTYANNSGGFMFSPVKYTKAHYANSLKYNQAIQEVL